MAGTTVYRAGVHLPASALPGPSQERRLVENLALGEDLGQQVADLIRREPSHGQGQPLDRGVVESLDRQTPPDRGVNNPENLSVIGKLVLNDVDFLLGFLGDR